MAGIDFVFAAWELSTPLFVFLLGRKHDVRRILFDHDSRRATILHVITLFIIHLEAGARRQALRGYGRAGNLDTIYRASPTRNETS